jgi:hypothetical protein
VRKSAVIGVLVALSASLPGLTPVRAQQGSPSPTAIVSDADPTTTDSIAAVFDAVRNVGDVDSAMSLFAAEAQVKVPPDVYKTPQQIEDWLRYLAAVHFAVEPGAHRITGNHASWDVEVTSDYVQALNLGSLRGTAFLSISGVSITSYTLLLDKDSTHRLREAQLAALDVMQNPIIVGQDAANVYTLSDVFRDPVGNLISFRDVIASDPGSGPYVDLWGEPVVIRSGI